MNTPEMTVKALQVQQCSADFVQLLELQQLFADADAQFNAVQSAADANLLAILDGAKTQYAGAKAIRDAAEAEIKALAAKHPEWIDGRSIKTPFGSIDLRSSTKIVVANPEATIALIDAIYSRPGSEWTPDKLVRTAREPNLEALDVLSDEQLAKIGARRESTESLTVKRAKVDLGKKGKAPKPTADVKEAA